VVREGRPGWGGPFSAALLAVLLSMGAPTPRASAAGEPGDRFRVVDAWARAAPASSARSVEGLALYLNQGMRDETEVARAAFTWIADNVAYDLAFGREWTAPDVVLEGGRAACYGYAALFKSLVEAMGLEGAIIIGHGKGRGYEPGQATTRAHDHMWNAVKIGGEWRLVDCTWGAGYVDDGGRFVRRFTDHYFLTPPEEFAYDHLPYGPRWQLVASPISNAEYVGRVNVKPPFFERGLRLVSHQSVRIETGSHLEVTIGAPPDTALTAALYERDRKLGREYTFAQREEKGFVVRATFPHRGSYVLQVFARPRNAVGEQYETALKYAVEARASAGSRAGFPEMYESFAARGCRVERPLSGELRAGTKVEFSLWAPGAEQVVAAKSSKAWWPLERRGDRFRGVVPAEGGELTVFARFPGKTRYEGLLKYVVR
jgi:hypothetical protein